MSASPNPMLSRLAGKVAVVTGGLSGLGLAIAERMAAEGAVVVAADLSAEAGPLDAVANPAPLRMDVSDPDSVAAMVTAVMTAHGRIDALVNCAGIGKEADFFDTTLEMFDRLVAINLRGTFIIGQAVARVMAAQGSGAILNVSSVSGMTGNVARTAYSATKGGVVGLSRAMAVDLAPRGVRVNVLAPGPIDTPLVAAMHAAEVRRQWVVGVPMHRYGRPEEVAGAAAYLCSDEASYVTGHVMAVDGGFLGAGLTAAPLE